MRRRSAFLVAPALLLQAAIVAGDDMTATVTSTAAVPACTITNPDSGTIGGFYDLRPDMAVPKEEGKAHPYKGTATEDYSARGWDYGYNFTLNICAPVIETPKHVVGVDSDLWKNISAYYIHDDETYSLGQSSLDLKSRGRKIVLQYTGGSPCGKKKSKRETSSVREGAAYKSEDFSDEEDDGEPTTTTSEDDDGQKPTTGEDDSDSDSDSGDKGKARDSGRKSATISFLCNQDASAEKAALSFVGADPDGCAYFFEARSHHACLTAEPQQPGGVGPGGVFALIVGIFLVVYFAGGVFYQRTVAHARGWRQLPNYNLWRGIFSFVTDLFVILTASCARFLPSRRGYGRLAISPTGRGRSREDENRLIDQLDEEWDD